MTKTSADTAPSRKRAWRAPLVVASGVLVLVFVLHAIDHVRQGLGRLTTEVTVGGQLLMLAAFAVFVLALRRHRVAPPVAVSVGLGAALAVAASHIAPHWSAFSDSYPDNNLDLLAWASMLAVIATAGIVALVGITELRRASEAGGGEGADQASAASVGDAVGSDP